jgi:hypothetical protein
MILKKWEACKSFNAYPPRLDYYLTFIKAQFFSAFAFYADVVIVFADDVCTWEASSSRCIEPSFSSFTIYPISCKFYHYPSFTQTLTLDPIVSMEHTLLSGMIFSPFSTITTLPITFASLYSVHEHAFIFHHLINYWGACTLILYPERKDYKKSVVVSLKYENTYTEKSMVYIERE